MKRCVFRWMSEAVTRGLLSALVLGMVQVAIVCHADELSFDSADDRITIRINDFPVTQFVFVDEQIARPYFANLRTAQTHRLSRRQPPLEGEEATDHDTMHPGVWLAFGDVNGHDFWRNEGRIEHVDFSEPPKVDGDQLRFAQRAKLVTKEGEEIGQVINRCVIRLHGDGWLVEWHACFTAGAAPLVFGDQEEMGFGFRAATELTETSGGTIVSSAGKIGAAATWGQAATWCDVSGIVGGEPVGVTLVPSPDNFRVSWWHNRDYGLLVANPFGRAAMKQGPKSEVVVAAGESWEIAFAAVVHQGFSFDPASFVTTFEFTGE